MSCMQVYAGIITPLQDIDKALKCANFNYYLCSAMGLQLSLGSFS